MNEKAKKENKPDEDFEHQLIAFIRREWENNIVDHLEEATGLSDAGSPMRRFTKVAKKELRELPKSLAKAGIKNSRERYAEVIVAAEARQAKRRR